MAAIDNTKNENTTNNYKYINKITCSICLDYVECTSNEKYETNCEHTFHRKCIMHWVEINKTCPMCRNGNTSEKKSKNDVNSKVYDVENDYLSVKETCKINEIEEIIEHYKHNCSIYNKLKFYVKNDNALDDEATNDKIKKKICNFNWWKCEHILENINTYGLIIKDNSNNNNTKNFKLII